MRSIKCVAVGDGAIGKTSLLVSYTTNVFPGEYVPTVFDNYSANLMAQNQTPVNLQLWDTAGQEEFKKLRPLSYPNTDVFIICFSLISPTSLENVVSNWVPEVHEFCPDVPFLLVGLKSDLRDNFESLRNDPQMRLFEPISEEQAKIVAKQIGAVDYIPCSAMKQINMSTVFEKAVEVALNPPIVQREQVETNTTCASCIIV